MDLSKCACFDGGSTWHDGAMAWEHHLEPNPDCPVHFPATDLSVKFEEPKVSGLTGAQWAQLRLWEDENRCDFEDELNNRCPDDTVRGSRFCGFHDFEYDEFDCYVDRRYE